MNPYESVTLPTPDVIAQMAATIYSSSAFTSETEHKRHEKSVSTAIALWKEGVSQLGREFETPNADPTEWYLYSQPLKIDNHFLPRLDKELFKKPNITLKKFLKATLGLTKIEDRIKWLRSYLEDTNRVLDKNYFDAAPSSNVKPLKIDSKKVEAKLKSYREHGVSDPKWLALAIRTWRLGKSKDRKDLPDKANIEDCHKAGAIHEKTKKS